MSQSQMDTEQGNNQISNKNVTRSDIQRAVRMGHLTHFTENSNYEVEIH